MVGKDSVKRVKPYLWFSLYALLEDGAASKPIRISTIELSKMLGGSQQSASRHLQLLEEMGLINRIIGPDGSLIRITDKGIAVLTEVLHGLKRNLEEEEMESIEFQGLVTSGLFEGAYYISKEGYRKQIVEKLGFDPYPGTLNLKLKREDLEKRKSLESLRGVTIHGFKDKERSFGPVKCYPSLINGEVEGGIIIADRTTHDESIMELISPIYLRKHFSLKDGDRVRVLAFGFNRRDG
ncbi:MAG: DUF120 domain-containing protein [Candidatus Bathyarchaeia archaeon]